jgi:NADH-quinone oxidoreductase subunit L
MELSPLAAVMQDRVVLALAAALLPLVSFVLSWLVGRRRPAGAAAVSITAIALSCAASLVILFLQYRAPGPVQADIPWMTGETLLIRMGVLLNPLTALMMVIVTTVSLLVQIYSTGYMKGDPGYSRFFAYLSLFSFSMLALVVADNFILLYMAWELVGLCSYLLIGFWYQKPEAARAARKAFVVTRVGDLGFLVGILFLSLLAGTFDFAGVASFIGGGNLSQGRVTLIVLLLFCGAIGKSGQFPLHVWLPDAMEGPTPVSALIHSATMVAAGVFMVARLFPIFQASADAMRVVAGLGAFTAAFAALIALAQNDIKKILAYSTISQLGYMMLALGVGGAGYTAGLFHLTTHASFKTLLFLGAGSVIHAMHTNDIRSMGGLSRRMPVTTITFAVAVLAIAGIFTLSGFWSKDEILEAVRGGGHTVLFAAALGTVFLTATYMSRLFFLAFTGASRASAHEQEATPAHAPAQAPAHAPAAAVPHESPAVMTVPMIVLAVLAAGLGAVGIPRLGGTLHAFLDPGSSAPGFDAGMALLSTGLAVAGILAGWGAARSTARSAAGPDRTPGFLYLLLANKFYVDELYGVLVRGVLYAITAAVAWFDRHVVDGMVNLVGGTSKRTGALLRKTVPGKVQLYALVVAGGMLAALVLLAARLGLLGPGAGR